MAEFPTAPPRDVHLVQLRVKPLAHIPIHLNPIYPSYFILQRTYYLHYEMFTKVGHLTKDVPSSIVPANSLTHCLTCSNAYQQLLCGKSLVISLVKEHSKFSPPSILSQPCCHISLIKKYTTLFIELCLHCPAPSYMVYHLSPNLLYHREEKCSLNVVVYTTKQTM